MEKSSHLVKFRFSFNQPRTEMPFKILHPNKFDARILVLNLSLSNGERSQIYHRAGRSKFMNW